MHIKFTSRPFDKLKTQCAVITVFSDIRPLQGNAALLDWRMNGRFSRILRKNRFEGQFQESLIMPSEGRVGPKEVMVLGLGAQKEFNEYHVTNLIQTVLDKVAHKKVSDFLISFSDALVDRFEWRNSIRLLVSKLHDYPSIETVFLNEPEDCVKDARKRHMDFGMNIEVSYEI